MFDVLPEFALYHPRIVDIKAVYCFLSGEEFEFWHGYESEDTWGHQDIWEMMIPLNKDAHITIDEDGGLSFIGRFMRIAFYAEAYALLESKAELEGRIVDKIVEIISS